jgi:hypothetical protein
MGEQSNNKRTNHYLDTPQGRMTIANASRTFGITRSILYKRLKKGIPFNEIFKIKIPSETLGLPTGNEGI